jgi:hypothetical protein
VGRRMEGVGWGGKGGGRDGRERGRGVAHGRVSPPRTQFLSTPLWRTFIFDVKFRLDCTTVGPIDGFQFKIVWLYRGWRQMAALYIQLGKAYYIRILTLKLDN